MKTASLELVLDGIVSAAGIAHALFARLFGERGLDLRRVASERPSDGGSVVWLGAEGTGLCVERERYLQRTRDDEIEIERDLRYSAGQPGDARWFELTISYQRVQVRIGFDGPELAPALRDDVFRAGTGGTETTYRALQTVRALAGLEQSAFGHRPAALEMARVPFRALSPREDRALPEILESLDAAAREGSRRAAVIAAVVRARNGALDAGLAGLDAVLGARPEEPDAAAMRALALVRAGRAAEARAALEAVPCTDEHDYLTRLFALLELGDLSAVLAQLDGPAPKAHDMHARMAAAVIAERLGDHAGALTRARAAIAYQPSVTRLFAERVPSPDAQPLLHRLETFHTWRALLAEATAAGT